MGGSGGAGGSGVGGGGGGGGGAGMGGSGAGGSGVGDVRAGKVFELDVADGTDDAAINQMCEKLLANTVIETYRIEIA